MAKKTKSKIDYEQVNCDSGDEEQPEDRHQQEQLKRPKPHSLSSSFRTASTSIETNECTEPLNCETAASDNIIEMGTNAAPPMYDERKMASNFDKFRLLMWKNFLIQYRHPIQTILEIMVPVLFSVILILIRSIVDPDIYTHNTVYKPFHINTLYPLRQGSDFVFEYKFLLSEENAVRDIHVKEWKLVYSPQNPILDNLVAMAAKSLELDGIVAVNDSEQLVGVMFTKELVAGIEFHHPANLTELPKNLSYSLRFPSESRTPDVTEPLIFNWHTNLLYPLFSTGGPRSRLEDYGGMPFYFQEGFLPIQDAIARTFTQITCNAINCENATLPDIQMQRYPYPPHILDVLLQGLETIVSFFILLSFIYPCINTVRFIAIEKERQLKETMKIMGLPSWLHWTTWFVRTMICMIVSVSFIVVLLKTRMFNTSVAVFTYSHWSTLWVYLVVFSISMTTFCFMLSVFFSKANTAAAVAGLVWFFLYVPFSFTQANYVQLSYKSKLIACLSSNTAMAYGFQIILRFEGTGEGLQWSNFWRPVTVDDNLTVGATMLFILIESLFYLLIALYVEKVMPGNFGVPSKWYFPFTAEFWCGEKEYSGVEDSSENDMNSNYVQLNFEPDPKNRRAGVKVKNLRKVYSNKKVACKGLSLNMFDDQITVLLGHNGAGKTTTMSMLTGMFPPTSGTALINGYDIRKNLQKARSSIGLCPQHNILFDELTVREHIQFYARLKGLNNDDIEEEVTKYVQLLELEPKIDAVSSSLSGGMQRKLSVGVALCGRSKVVFCDEPTSGMNPAARRALWDLLQREKKGRTILLTTHFMDEADVLGDRIAIMADGELKCCGTSFFLKKRFGTGYRLVCVKNEDCETKNVTNVLQEYIPGIQVQEDIASELAYALPDEYVDKFEKLFQRLEEKQEALKLGSFGVSLTTLEEVFLKVGSDSNFDKPGSIMQQHNGQSNGHGNTNFNIHNEMIINDIEAPNAEIVPELEGFNLRVNQWSAMFKKRYYCWIRSWVLFFLQNLIPMTFIVISVLVVRMMADNNALPDLKISLERYDRTVTMLQKPETSDAHMESIFSEYRHFIQNSGSDNTLDEFNEDIQAHFLELAKTMLVRLNERYLAGISLDNNSQIIAWFNNQPFHTSALSLDLVHNAVIKSKLGADYSVKVSNKPLPFRVESTMSLLMASNNMGFQLATNISFAMAFVSSFYIMFYIKERVSKAKLLQFVSGLNVSTFWITSFIFDFATYILSAFILILTLWVFQEDGWKTFQDLSPAFVSLVLFGFSMLPITFLFSLLFSIPSTGFVRMTIFYVFTGITVFFVIVAMPFPAFKLADTAATLKWIFLVFPHYSLSSSLYNLNQKTTMDRVCTQKCQQFVVPLKVCRKMICKQLPQCCETATYAFEEPGIGRNLIYMVATGVAFFIILLIIEYRVFEGLTYYIHSFFERKLPPMTVEGEIDNDVDDEKKRVKQMTMADLQSNNLVLQSLSKFYGKFLAVNQISIGIQRAECFGLLGVNGAGKTSTFKMLTGDKKISSGEAYVRGISLKNNMPSVHKVIGYCPQFDALLEDLTGTETLELFALLRGIRPKNIPILSQRLTNDLNFTKHIEKKVGEYSGGNKRKLSTAVALIGNPIVVYLDEPTTGMDPGAKRNLWNMVSKVRSSGKSIVLTSHSMEECEALCTRLAIMVNGEFKCLGSTQHLKNKFSKGLSLTIKAQKNEDADSRSADAHISGQFHLRVIRIKEFVQRNFPGANLKEEYQGLLTYYVPPSNTLKWSSMFGLMETAKRTLHIKDYSISQTSLEQVFLSFTKFQREEIITNRSANR